MLSMRPLFDRDGHLVFMCSISIEISDNFMGLKPLLTQLDRLDKLLPSTIDLPAPPSVRERVSLVQAAMHANRAESAKKHDVNYEPAMAMLEDKPVTASHERAVEKTKERIRERKERDAQQKAEIEQQEARAKEELVEIRQRSRKEQEMEREFATGKAVGKTVQSSKSSRRNIPVAPEAPPEPAFDPSASEAASTVGAQELPASWRSRAGAVAGSRKLPDLRTSFLASRLAVSATQATRPASAGGVPMSVLSQPFAKVEPTSMPIFEQEEISSEKKSVTSNASVRGAWRATDETESVTTTKIEPTRSPGGQTRASRDQDDSPRSSGRPTRDNGVALSKPRGKSTEIESSTPSPPAPAAPPLRPTPLRPTPPPSGPKPPSSPSNAWASPRESRLRTQTPADVSPPESSSDRIASGKAQHEASSKGRSGSPTSSVGSRSSAGEPSGRRKKDPWSSAQQKAFTAALGSTRHLPEDERFVKMAMIVGKSSRECRARVSAAMNTFPTSTSSAQGYGALLLSMRSADVCVCSNPLSRVQFKEMNDDLKLTNAEREVKN